MIQVIHRALDIVELILRTEKKELPLREIANSLELKHSTCSNILKTLTERNFLVKSPKTKCYSMGPLLLSIMSDDLKHEGLIASAKDIMRDLSTQTNESCMLGVLKDDKRITLHEETVEHDLKVINKTVKSVYQTSSGRVILAFMEHDAQVAFIKKNGMPKKGGWEGVTNAQSLQKKLDTIKNNKFAIHANTSHILGMAVPLHKDGKVVAALGIYLPEVRFTSAAEKNIMKHMFAAQKKIDRSLSAQKK